MMKTLGNPSRKEKGVLAAVVNDLGADQLTAVGYSYAEAEGLVTRTSPCAVTVDGDIVVYDDRGERVIIRESLADATHDGRGAHVTMADGGVLRVLGHLNDELRKFGTIEESSATLAAFRSARRLDGPISINLHSCEVAGGAGFPLRVGDIVNVSFSEDGYAIHTQESEDSITGDYEHLVRVALSGPGRETSGGGFIGGGFGLEGAAIGMGIATILNAVTTNTTVTSIIELTTTDGELFLVNGSEEPGTLRFILSPVLVRLRMVHAADATHL